MKMVKQAVLMALLMAGPAVATQEYILPTLFDVQDVAADDVLNIREAPDASSAIIGTLAPDATGIEVVATDRSGQWGQVNAGERAGWVSMRFLVNRTDVWQPGALPAGFTCGGTEPFWSLAPKGDALVWWTPDGETAYRGLHVLDTGVFRSPRRALVAGSGDQALTASVTPAWCSDGMSEMAFGLEATVILQGAAGPQLYSGCCRIAR
ncbi:SH3 domain-containing protein [uncultured Paracoccus sp.]|nr:SH3 domain-containing protein [uncultured Paracoccus sp.]